jgi:type IV pilus assembly protein PilB
MEVIKKMIRNYTTFYLAIGALFVGVLCRYTTEIEGALGMPGVLENNIPGIKYWVVLAVLLVVVSLIPLDSLFPRQKPAPLKRKNFVLDASDQISKRIVALCEEVKPDVPLIVDYVVFQARTSGASDIHFDPSREGFTVRFRLDGMMTDVAKIPPKLTSPVANRFKVLSNLIVYEGFKPQDGRLESSEEEQKTSRRGDFRIAFMPTLHGERIVIRILGRSGDAFDFHELGMTDSQRKAMNTFIAQPQGMIVLTGPTGSGKSTTIYAALRTIQEQTHSVRSISTLEDPIEYEIAGINQSQVNEKKNFTFDQGLRALLRQDPDVIMVGEIRDPETAAIAIQAGMTGHLIITTVHANSTAATFSRLLEMGVAPYSINTAVTAIIAQRLVRKICVSCRIKRPLTGGEMQKLGITDLPNTMAFEGKGCAGCNGSGYKGRYALYEILEVTEKIRALVAKETSADEIYTEAKKEGMKALFESGLNAVATGVTTPEEIFRTIVRDES